jgi:hypothetical protein
VNERGPKRLIIVCVLCVSVCEIYETRVEFLRFPTREKNYYRVVLCPLFVGDRLIPIFRYGYPLILSDHIANMLVGTLLTVTVTETPSSGALLNPESRIYYPVVQK